MSSQWCYLVENGLNGMALRYLMQMAAGEPNWTADIEKATRYGSEEEAKSAIPADIPSAFASYHCLPA